MEEVASEICHDIIADCRDDDEHNLGRMEKKGYSAETKDDNYDFKRNDSIVCDFSACNSEAGGEINLQYGHNTGKGKDYSKHDNLWRKKRRDTDDCQYDCGSYA